MTPTDDLLARYQSWADTCPRDAEASELMSDFNDALAAARAEVERLQAQLAQANKAWGDLYYDLPNDIQSGYEYLIGQLDAAFAVSPTPTEGP